MEIAKQHSRKNRQKLLDGEQNMPSVDRLSGLPDAVLCHILYFLPTKLFVATNILAKRWRFLWSHVPNLDFDGENHGRGTSFSNIINRIMFLHKVQNLTTFRLYYKDNNISDYELETWVMIAMARNVQNLDVRLGCLLMLPRCLFTCKTLVDLRLIDCMGVPSSCTISLPSLKKLQFQIDEALPHLLIGCPVLEELIIDDIYIIDVKLDCFNIFSLTLKRLTVNFPFDSVIFCGIGFKVKINAPALTYLNLQDSVSTHISAQMLTYLIEADILFGYCMAEGEDYYFKSMVKFIDSLCNMKCLKLSSDLELESDRGHADHINRAFVDQSISIRRFNSLTKLELAADWFFLTKFLESADNLEVLIILEVRGSMKNWVKPKQVPTCLLSHLRSVRIDLFEGMENEFSMVRYLLWNAKVLERGLHRISLFQRRSACEIAFY
ncbi:hypothetical protein DH2020_021948 [Rehmannia glutinosa]|uniref:F-box protein n=1 Tax=Rehmannia glutinosa TaxID=99300 RepID=A0ABR0WE59_REHGL